MSDNVYGLKQRQQTVMPLPFCGTKIVQGKRRAKKEQQLFQIAIPSRSLSYLK